MPELAPVIRMVLPARRLAWELDILTKVALKALVNAGGELNAAMGDGKLETQGLRALKLRGRARVLRIRFPAPKELM